MGRVLITWGWVLLTPFAVIALFYNGFIAEAWQDERRDHLIRSIEEKARSSAALEQLVAKSRRGALAPVEFNEYVRLIHVQAEKFAGAVAALNEMKVREKDRLVHADLVNRYKRYALAYRGLADAYDTKDPNTVKAARDSAQRLLGTDVNRRP